MTILEMLAGFSHGFAILLSPTVLLTCVVGLAAGTIGGFLPGLSTAGALALGYPILILGSLATYLGDQSPLVLMLAFAYGTFYGRALAAMNLTGSAAVGATVSPKSGRSALIGITFVGIAVAVFATALVAIGRHALAASLGPAELAAIVVFVLLGGAAFGRGSVAAALAMIVLGLLLRLVGSDAETGLPRFTFGLSVLEDGISFGDVALGLFVIANVIDDLVRFFAPGGRDTVLSDRPDHSIWQTTILAVLAGFLPTNGSTSASTVGAQRARPQADLFDPASYRSPAQIMRAALMSDIRFSVSMVPLLLWLAPVDAMTALLRGAVGGQAVLASTGADLTQVVWLAGATLVLAHLVPLIIIACLSARQWRAFWIDIRIVASLLVAACIYSSWEWHDSDHSGVGIMLVFGLIGYAMIRAGFDRSLMFFSFAVGLTFEENVRRSLLIFRGDPLGFLERPISAAFLVAGVLLFVVVRTLRHQNHLLSWEGAE